MLFDNHINNFNSRNEWIIEKLDNKKEMDFNEIQVNLITQKLAQYSQYNKICLINLV